MNTWDQTHELNKNMVTHVIESQFDIKITSLDLLGEGYDNIAYWVNQQFVFRFPKRELGVIAIENEISLLPFLATQLSFPFSYPTMIGKTSDIFPFPFAGYPLLPGPLLADYQQPPVNQAEFAHILATWLKELHAIPLLQPSPIIKGYQSWRVNIQERTKRILHCLEQYAGNYTDCGFNVEILKKAVLNLSELQFSIDRECYLHGDLYSKHILVNQQGLPSALIDWGDTHVGHPGVDLSVGIMIFDEKSLEVFLSTYGNIDNNTLTIATFRAFCHSIMALPYFYQNNDSALSWTKSALNNAFVFL